VPLASANLDYLFALEHFGIKFGLENIRAILERLGHPERAYRTVHVAGTNGKGSVTAMVDAALRAAGRRSARYTSPHLIDLRERFVVDGRPVSGEALEAAVGDVRRAIDALTLEGTLAVQPTFFEVTTAIAFELFRRAAVDIAVIEVGLGGRLDATNVLAPEVTAITSIALDHEQYLGSTIRQIAVEKAGVIKSGVPVVVGRVDAEALDAINVTARERGAPVVIAWDGVTVDREVRPDRTRVHLRTPAHDYGGIDLALPGDHQIDNAVVAVRMLELLDVPAAATSDGLAHVSWPGRLDVRRFADGREAILDAAHNPAGAAALASYLKTLPGEKRPLVFAAMRDKDIDGMFRALAPTVGTVVLTRASTRRAAEPDALAARVRTVAPALPVVVEPSPADALAAAWRLSPHIVVAGSIFLLGDVLRGLDRT
jgi:dihydrofolate synthase / folylpolyglutamate synthase